jgi:hypothetical protein
LFKTIPLIWPVVIWRLGHVVLGVVLVCLVFVQVAHHCTGALPHGRFLLSLLKHSLLGAKDHLTLLLLGLPDQVIIVAVARLIYHLYLYFVLGLGRFKVLQLLLQLRD